MDYIAYFKDKKITQLGLGLLGRGLGDAIFLAECGADLIVTDLKTEEELKTSVEKLKKYPNITLHLGGHNLEDFRNRDMILKGPGIPLDSIYIEEARKNGIPIEMDASIFVKLLPKGVTTIGITGTRGKSTVTHLCSHILKNVGMRVFLGGNVRDMATLPLIKNVLGNEIVVLELDSWQLQGFGDSKISPHIAVFTTFMPDHLNYYKDSMSKYFEDKANIFKFQKEGDTLVVGEGLEIETLSIKKIAKKENVPKDWDIKIIGDHNLLNISCAIEACRAAGILDEDIRKGVESFGGVEGRLQFVKEVGGIKIYNDNNATTPQATIAALEALKGLKHGNIHLLCGGADKQLDVAKLSETISKTCKETALLKGSGSEKLKLHLKDYFEVSNLEEGVKQLLEECEPGDTFIFSPAFASFGLFKNEYERNDEFMRIVNSL